MNISSNSDQDSESSMSADSDSDAPPGLEKDDAHPSYLSERDKSRHSRVSKISVIMGHLAEQIKLLYNASMLLTRPGLNGRYLRSGKTDSNDDNLENFEDFDYRHICEKVKQWKRDRKPVTEEEVEMRKDRGHLGSEPSEILCRRLARGNTRRRQQLRYWSRHPDEPKFAQYMAENGQKIVAQQPPVSAMTGKRGS